MDAFARRLLAWYNLHGRHDLPWQHPRTPYRVWVSEVMLQQTQVATVIPYFLAFVAALPDVASLARASEDRVLALWSGLGYYRRARHLHAAARQCVAQWGGELPRDFHALAALPGIGRSTAGAILALARGQRQPILDGNVKRVLARYHGVPGWPGERAVENALWAHAEAHTPASRVADYTQAIMDLGATLCTRAAPRCGECPQKAGCVARRDGNVADLPGRRPPRALPEKHAVLVLLRDRRRRVLLQRRPPQGVWPGLWSLPEAASLADARVVARRLAEATGDGVEQPALKHVFTHYILRAQPLAWHDARPRETIADAPETRWCSSAAIAKLGVPAPIRRLLCDDPPKPRRPRRSRVSTPTAHGLP